MAEYIERETLLTDVCNDQCGEKYSGVCENCRIIALIADMPAADVAPVVHGRWEFLGPNRLIKECMCGTCSVCKVRSKYIVNTMLCPNCGAHMRNGG